MLAPVPLTLDELDARSAELDAEVVRSPHVDRFCSSSDWILPAARTLHAAGAPFVHRLDGGWITLVGREGGGVTVLEPLEAMWGLACPLIGASPVELATEAAALFAASPVLTRRRAVLALSGLPTAGPLLGALAAALEPRFALRVGPVTRRRAASLDGGVDGFLARRSSSFRNGLRRAQRRAHERGLRFERLAGDDATALYARILAVEEQSWKGREGVGFAWSEMVEFYRQMVPRLVARGAFRGFVAVDAAGADRGFIFGGLLAGIYRGLQFSFAEGFEDCALGNLLQLTMIEALCAEGVTLYDLGTEVEYKQRWAERTDDSVLLVAIPR